MEDIEIYQFAGEIISSIAGDLQQGIYSDLNGTLSLAWSEVKTFNAWAESLASLEQPPQHKIGFHYELVRQIYRDVEAYCDYIESEVDADVFSAWFQDHSQPAELLPAVFSSEACRKNMFIGAITWIFFHELAHVNQEHGFIRRKFIGGNGTSIHECSINTDDKIDGRAAAVYHVTEMAADFEAVTHCIAELIRHFEGEDLVAALKLYVSGLSCVLYRFHGAKEFVPVGDPEGTHPSPLVRLENVLPQIYELFSIPEFNRNLGIDLDRKAAVEMCTRAGVTAGLFWLRCTAEKPGIPENYFLMGNLNRPGVKRYLNIIISTWDELHSDIKKVKRFGPDITMLRFSHDIREKLNEGA